MDATARPRWTRCLFLLGALGSLTPWVGPSGALLLGLGLALTTGNPWPQPTAIWTRRTLAWSVAGLGAGMNLTTVLKTGSQGLLLTFGTILATLGLGLVLAWLFRVRGKAGFLVVAGTAICGGSAIAALAPAIDAPEEDVGIALATVFLLNALALVLFPPLGHALGLSQRAFGLWSALAIHDTSSVVGAGLAYGNEALAVATTVKLARALWIVPLVLGASFLLRRQRSARRQPWFILGFLATAALGTWVPAWAPAGRVLVTAAHKGMALALFGVGAAIHPTALKQVGPRPLWLGLLLWMAVAMGMLQLIRLGWI